jgi:hypothetical protein
MRAVVKINFMDFFTSSHLQASPEGDDKRLEDALLGEKYETWSTGRKYFDMIEYLEARVEELDLYDSEPSLILDRESAVRSSRDE